MTTQTTPEELAKGPQAAFASLAGERHQRLALSIFNLLAEGNPVEIQRLAERTGRGEAEVIADLTKPPFESFVYRGEAGRLVGFGGLGVGALGETRHRLRLDGRELYAWCAEDALNIPIVLNREVRVESSCPITGERISLTVSPKGFTDLEPSTAVMSFLDPDAFEAGSEESWGGDVIRNGCHFIHFFASSQAAQEWISEHPGTLQLSIEDGFEVGRRWIAYAYGVGPDR